jgi:hypothetical protein
MHSTLNGLAPVLKLLLVAACVHHHSRVPQFHLLLSLQLQYKLLLLLLLAA